MRRSASSGARWARADEDRAWRGPGVAGRHAPAGAPRRDRRPAAPRDRRGRSGEQDVGATRPRRAAARARRDPAGARPAGPLPAPRLDAPAAPELSRLAPGRAGRDRAPPPGAGLPSPPRAPQGHAPGPAEDAYPTRPPPQPPRARPAL